MGHTTQLTIAISLVATLAATACGEDTPRVLPPPLQDWRDEPDELDEPDGPAGDPRTSDQDRDGWLDAAEVAMGTNPNRIDNPCTSAIVQTTGAVEVLDTKLDLVVMLDTSGSMVEEMPFIREGLFATIERAEESEGAIRLIVVADDEVWCDRYQHDPHNPCDERSYPRSPQLTYVWHLVDSWNTFEVFMKTYTESWGGALREDASLVILNITDEDSDMPWQTFEQSLREEAPDVFFPGGDRGYVWNSVTGVALGARSSVASNTGIVEEACETALDAGVQYQALSRASGGLRFSVCGDNDYEGLFDEIVLASTTPTECAIALNTDDGRIDRFRSSVQIEVEGASPEILQLVSPACTERGYYIVGDYVVLCEEVCDGLQGEPVTIRAGAECVCGTSPTLGCME